MRQAIKNPAYRRKSVDQRRRELVAAGIACLGDGGMSGFTIERIRRQAGVSRGLINHHFKSKDELLLSIYDAMTAHMLAEDEQGRPIDFLRRIVDFNFDENSFNTSNLRAWLAVWGEIAGNRPLFELHRQRYRLYKSRIEAALGAIADEQSLDIATESLARQLIAMIDGLWLEHCLHPEEFSLAIAREDCYCLLQVRGIPL